MEVLSKLDLFPKLKAEDTVRTTHGACLSLVAFAVMAYLFVSEYAFYRRIEVVDRLFVNSTHGEHLKVTFDVDFPHVPCELLSLDALDQSGQPMAGGGQGGGGGDTRPPFSVKKRSLRAPPVPVRKGDRVLSAPETVKQLGTIQGDHHLESAGVNAHLTHHQRGGCGNCYGAEAHEGECCDTCEQVRAAYQAKGWVFKAENVEQCGREQVMDGLGKAQAAGAEEGGGGGGEGCNIEGTLDLTSVTGNFHFAPHSSLPHAGGFITIQELIQGTFEAFNVTHTVRGLRFGEHFPGITNPLDGRTKVVGDTHCMYQYYLKVVPTVYQYLDGSTVVSNQYSVTEHMRHLDPGSGRGLPGVWFIYEVSPVHARFEEASPARTGGPLAFVASVCAILGGTYTVLGLAHEALGAALARLHRTTRFGAKPGELGR